MNPATSIAGSGTPRARDPFAALPHRIAGDPRVSPLGKAILLALLYFARREDHCWPSDASIGRRVGRSEATVQRALRHLQGLGLIERRKTDANRTGRVIRLTWRAGNGEGPPPAGMTGRPPAGMRDEGDPVIVQGETGKEIGGSRPQRSRPGASVPVPPPAPVHSPRIAPPPAPGPGADPGGLEVCRRDPIRAEVPAPARPPTAPPRGPEPGSRSADEVRPDAPGEITPGLRARPTRPSIARGSPAPTAAAVLTPAEQARLAGLPESAREQVLRWVALGDPICLGEARRLLAPPRPPEPPPQTLATPELLRGLPGRPDRVAAAAGRLTAELGDAKSYAYYRSAAEAVSARRQPAEALVAAWRQGSGPRSVCPGAVFATAWKRATRAPS